MTDGAPKRIWAWITGIQPLQGNAGLWRSDEWTITDDEYILAAEHDRIVADYLAVIDHLHHEHDNWRGLARLALAQFEALAELAPPPQKGLLLRRLKELAAKRGGERKP